MKIFFTFFALAIFISCTPEEKMIIEEEGGVVVQTPAWLIAQDEVFDGGPGKDGIPSIDAPIFIETTNEDYLESDELVIAMSFGDHVRVYPHSILDWHEIVNDNIRKHNYALTYCPLTGTAVAWNREIDGKITQFGVSGLLYNSNLIPYDRETDSYWSQMRLDCVNGDLKGKEIETYQVFETSWETARKLPNVRVLSTETGFSRDYGRYPYGDYRTNHDFLIFPISNQDERLGNKDRVLGLISHGVTKGYSFGPFESQTTMIKDVFEGDEIFVIGDKSKNFIVAFYLDQGKTITVLKDEFPNLFQDERGNIYDAFGFATSGPDKGIQLRQPVSFIGYWFAWAAFYPEITLRR